MTAKLGKNTGGAPRLSSWADAGYKAALNPGYVEAVQTQMQHTRPTSVFREGWSEVVLQIVDTIHAMVAGTPAQEAADGLQETLAGTFQ
ncbi:hypothetical protein NKI20_12510 [Mesorhizobium sp. M0830]|uniref:hypothetical protein n=1 Tax=Mesorhizobium sp. M0830 TaxID=2957008 RepID=UPI00333D4915